MTASFLAYLSIFETRQNILVKLEELTLGISKVFQISSKSSHKIQLILAILMVLYTFLYLPFLSNPLGELGCIIHRWKGMNEEIAASLES